MHVTHRVQAGLLSLLVLVLSIGAAATAQTPSAEIVDPCASFVFATPNAGGSSEPAADEPLPDIDADDAVVGALAIRQGHVVTTLEAIIAIGGDPDVVSFATELLPTAQEQLDALRSIANEEVTAHPAAMVAVLDMLRQEQDLPADQGDLDAYLSGYMADRVCLENIDREAVSQQTLMANDAAISEIAGIGELVIGDEATLELVLEISTSASDRLAWFQARTAPGATPAASPAG